MPPLSFFRSSGANGSSSNNTATASPTAPSTSSVPRGTPSPVRPTISQAQSQSQTYPQPLIPARLPTPPSPRTSGTYPRQPPPSQLGNQGQGQSGSGASEPGERGLGFPFDPTAGPRSSTMGYSQDEPRLNGGAGPGVLDLGEFGIGVDRPLGSGSGSGSGRFGSGSFGRARKPVPPITGSPSSTSNQTIFMNPPGTPTRSSSFPREQEELSTPRGGYKMGSIAEGIPFTAPPVFGGMMSSAAGGGISDNMDRGPRSAGLVGSFPTSSMTSAIPGSSSHMHHRSLSIAPSSSGTDMPPPSPRARPPKPRGHSESGNVEKRRAGWFAGLVAGGQGTQSKTQGPKSTVGESAVANGQTGTNFVEGEPRTRRLGSGSSILSNPFSSSKDQETHSNQSHGPRGSMDDETGPPVGRSVSLRRGFRNRVSSAGTVASTTPSVGGLSISGPIGPMIKATHEEILQEFGRLNPDVSHDYERGAEQAIRSNSLDQGLKLRANSFSAAERPNFSSGSLEENAVGVGFKLAARVVGSTGRPMSTLPTSAFQRPVTPERTQLAQIPGTPVAQMRSETPSNPGRYPTPLSPPPPTRKPTIGSRNAGPPPAPFAWPSRGVEAGCLSPRNPSRNNSFEVNLSPRDFPGTTFRPNSPAGTKPTSEHTEWLARKPSTSLEYARELGRPLNLVRSHEERMPKKKPTPLLSRPSDSPLLPHLRQRASDESEVSRYATSGVEADEDSEEQLSSVEDAVIARAERVISPRKDSFSSNALSTGTSPQSPSILPRDHKDDYYVETVCVPSADKDTMRWEVIIRRKLVPASIGSADAPTSTGPVQLSETRTVTKAPSTSSSLNLSLSLDNPRGKLAFLSLPTAIGDPHATPVRSRSTVQSSSGLAKARVDASPAPSPSPSPSQFSIQSGFSRFESRRTNSETSMSQAPPLFSTNSKGSISETRRQLSELMPASPMSPGAPLTPTSPPASPRETVVRQRRKASLQGGVLYTRNLDTQV